MEETKKYREYFSSETIDSLYNLWDEIGYNEEEKKIRLHRLVQRIQNVHSDFIESTLRKCQNLTRKTNEIKDKHIHKLEAMGASDEEIQHVKETEILGTIKDKYIDTLNNYNEFLNIYNQRVDNFKKYYIQIQSCFKEIGVIDTVPECCDETDEMQEEEEESQEPIEEESQKEIEDGPSINSNENEEPNNASNEIDDQTQDKDVLNDKNKTHTVSGYSNKENPQSQGEFAQIGEDDLSLDRLRRFESKAKELQNEVDIRFSIFNEIKTKILKLQSDLCEVSPPEIEELLNGDVYSDVVCDRLTDYEKYLSEIFETRKKYVSEMAIEIVKLWDLLDVDETTRNQFLQTHSVFSQKNVQDCIDEAERLTQIRNERLPEIIEKIKKEISHICDDLSYSEEQKQEIYDKCNNDMLNENSPQDMKFYEENKGLFIDFDDSKDEEGDNDNIEEEEEEHEEDIKSDNINEEKKVDNTHEEDEENKKLLPIFNNYESELFRLKRIHLVARPIIDSIKQRQEMIDEYNNLMEKLKQTNETANKPSKATKTKEKVKTKAKNKEMAKSAPIKKKKNVDDDKRTNELNGEIELKTIRVRPPNAQDKIYQEKVIRRYKTVLPRLEKKLLIMLIQFREENGEDFIWEQKPIINELKHIHVTQSEIRAQNKNRNKSIAAAESNPRITYNANATSTKQRKSLEPSRKKMKMKTRNQRKSTIPVNPNKE